MLKILDYIDLLLYDTRFDELYSRLVKLKKDSYNNDERIVILHVDTEYFYYNNLTGFTTHNLFTIIKQLDIPLFVFVFLTNYSQFQKSIKPFVTNDDQPEVYNLIVNPQSMHSGKIKELLTLNISKDIKFHAVCLLGTQRNHRIKLFQFLKYSGLDQIINFSFNDKTVLNKSKVIAVTGMSIISSLDNLVFSNPHRINESWLSKSTALNYLNHIPTPDTVNQWIDSNGVDFYRYYAIDIVTETVFDYPHVFISEKTLRPIALKTVFVMFGASGTLKYLRQHGFKTFGDFWDESYDDIVDPHERFSACCNILTILSKLTVDDINNMYLEMIPILEHNKQILSDYIDNVYDPLYNKFKMAK